MADIRLLIYGSRTWTPTIPEVRAAVGRFMRGLGIAPGDLACVVTGKANGADAAGEAWARRYGITVEEYPAQWKRPDGSTDYSAGPKRNAVMATKCTHAIGFRDDGKSNGTDDMTRRLVERATPHIVLTRGDVARLVHRG